MATSVNCDKYGFFNGVMAIEQSNWANYWKGVIPDGVVANIGNECLVTPNSGRVVNIGTGQIMVDNHKCWVNSTKQLELTAASSSNPRIDCIVARVTYGNMGQSTAVLAVKTGTPASSPVAPTLTKTTGGTYEYAIAEIYVGKSASNITAENITDTRFVFSLGAGSVTSFSETRTVNSQNQAVRYCKLTVQDGREYRASNVITNTFEITLPTTPNSTFMCAVNFTTGSDGNFSYQGVTFKRDGSTYSIKTQDQLTIRPVRYNMIIWWDGSYYWCAARTASV